MGSNPPLARRNFQLPGKYPEKGVRVMKISEAYPVDWSAPSDLKTTGLKKSYPISQKSLR